MSLLDRIRSLFGFTTEHDWEKNPEHYYICPECERVAVNAKWRLRDHKKDEVLFVYHGQKHYKREMQYKCPNCEQWMAMDRVLSLDEHEAFDHIVN